LLFYNPSSKLLHLAHVPAGTYRLYASHSYSTLAAAVVMLLIQHYLHLYSNGVMTDKHIENLSYVFLVASVWFFVQTSPSSKFGGTDNSSDMHIDFKPFEKVM
jgi:hypothetical protein